MKKKTARTASLFLSAILLCTLLPLPARAASFTDVPSGSWYAGAVTDLVDRGIIQGTSPSTFSPNSKLTRGAFVTMLAKTALSEGDLKQYEFQGGFRDVAKKHWSNRYVNWASETGIVRGYEDKTFRPDKPVSRQEMAVMTVNFARSTGRKLPEVNAPVTFADSSKISKYAVSSVRACQQAGIISGYKDNTFRPEGLAIRAEAASLYSRFLENCLTGDYQIVRKRVYNTPVRAVILDPSAYTAGLVLGRDLVDGAEAASSLVKRTGASIAVNAAFFDMSSYVPLGTLISDGRVVTVDNKYAPDKSAFVMDSTGKFSVESFTTLHSAALLKEDGTESTVDHVGVNKWPSSDKDATRIIYTRDWGHTLCFPARDAVTVDENGVITAVDSYKDVDIPEKGFVIAQRARREYEGDFFDSCKAGQTIEIERYYEGASTQDLTLSIGAGPRIVKNGAVYGDQSTYRAEGFSDPNITSYDAVRVCIGIRKDGSLIIVNASTDLAQLSKIMVSFGCTDAINFDGGGSANVYVDGQWLYGPGDRLLNNMLYFK